jgi:hypothetical protein
VNLFNSHRNASPPDIWGRNGQQRAIGELLAFIEVGNWPKEMAACLGNSG